jgi:hypothetical protein
VADSRPYSPEPWKQDVRDRKTVLDGYARLVAVTTSREDAARIVAGVNAARGLAAEGLEQAPLADALQVLYEICLYHSDVKFRNHVDRRGGLPALLERADTVWRAFGEDAFQVEGATPKEKDVRSASGDGDGDDESAAEPAEAAASAKSSSRAAAPATGAPGGVAEATKRPAPGTPVPPPAAKKPLGK